MNLKELSEKLGLSQTTVSRALNGYPEVSQSTRERVEKAAERYNYRPNTKARSLAMGKSMAIAHVIPVAERIELVNPIFGDFMSGASESYAQAGYDIMLSIAAENEIEKTYEDLKNKGAVDGIVIHSPKLKDNRFEFLTQINMPFVVHGRGLSGEENYSWVDVDNYDAFRMAGDHLLDLGHSRIALINGREERAFAMRRRMGLEYAMNKRGVSLDPDLCFQDDMTELYGHRAMQACLRGNNPPTAAVVSSMLAGMGARRALYEAGLEMGRDVSVVVFDDDVAFLKNGSADIPVFTTVLSSVREAGVIAGKMLIEIIHTPNMEHQSRLLAPTLVVGSSSKLARK